MEDFSEITDLETARRVLIGYDRAFREHAEIHTEMEAEIERLREALRTIADHEVAEYPTTDTLADFARSALQQKDNE